MIKSIKICRGCRNLRIIERSDEDTYACILEYDNSYLLWKRLDDYLNREISHRCPYILEHIVLKKIEREC